MVYGTCDSSNCAGTNNTSKPSAILSTVARAGHAPGNHLSSTQDLGIKVAALVGTLVGQLVFGWLADKVGRKRMCKCFWLRTAGINSVKRDYRWYRVDGDDHLYLWSGYLRRRLVSQCDRYSNRMAFCDGDRNWRGLSSERSHRVRICLVRGQRPLDDCSICGASLGNIQ